MTFKFLVQIFYARNDRSFMITVRIYQLAEINTFYSLWFWWWWTDWVSCWKTTTKTWRMKWSFRMSGYQVYCGDFLEDREVKGVKIFQ